MPYFDGYADQDDGFESTYKELKLGTAQVFSRVAKRFESTYKELKYEIVALIPTVLPGFESTYKELKFCFSASVDVRLSSF